MAASTIPDNAWRFARVQPCGARVLAPPRQRPSVIHAHDWQTGLVPVYQKMQFSTDPVDWRRACRVHDSQPGVPGCVSGRRSLPELGLGWEVLDIQALEYWGQISYLKGGINFSERITTVSPIVCARDPDAGARVRLRRRAAAALPTN